MPCPNARSAGNSDQAWASVKTTVDGFGDSTAATFRDQISLLAPRFAL